MTWSGFRAGQPNALPWCGKVAEHSLARRTDLSDYLATFLKMTKAALVQPAGETFGF